MHSVHIACTMLVGKQQTFEVHEAGFPKTVSCAKSVTIQLAALQFYPKRYNHPLPPDADASTPPCNAILLLSALYILSLRTSVCEIKCRLSEVDHCRVRVTMPLSIAVASRFESACESSANASHADLLHYLPLHNENKATT